MTFEIMRFFVLNRANDWLEIGAMIRIPGAGSMTFHPRPGFDAPTSELVRNAELASDAGTADQLWGYYEERALGGLSATGKPDSMEGKSAADVAARLYPAGDDGAGSDSDRRSDREG